MLALLNEAHVPCAPVKTAREVAHDPHLEARGFWVDVEHPRPRQDPRADLAHPPAHRRQVGNQKSSADAGQHGRSAGRVAGMKAEELLRLRADEVTVPVTERKKK